jgi:RNA polymerase sigma-70 factor (ECF subfamily)
VESKPEPEDLSLAVSQLRKRFHDEADALRPSLHRFCSRMLGSVTDGEDAVQETLALAFYKLPELVQENSLRPWLFRIAHNKCLDLLRFRQRFRRRFVAMPDDRDDQEEYAATASAGDPAPDEAMRELAERALVSIVAQLPQRERASVVLKDVLDYSLEETATITDASVGSVKAALHRGRAKLRECVELPPRRFTASERAVVDRWIACFNQRDWDGVQALLAPDATLDVVGRTSGSFGNTYFTNYGKLPEPWKLAVASVDGEEAIVHFRERNGVWEPHAMVVLKLEDGHVRAVRDYVHVGYLLSDATVQRLDSPA